MLDLLKPLLQQARKQKRGRKAKSKPVFVSRKIELQYAKELLAISATCQKIVNDLLLPSLDMQVGDSSHVVADGLLSRVKNALNTARETVVNQVTDYAAEKLAEVIVKKQAAHADKQLADNIKLSTGIDIQGLFDGESLVDAVNEAITANVALIKSIPSTYSSQIEAAVLRGLQEGRRAEDIKKDIFAIGESTDQRALLIARDQLGKINGRLTQIRQQKLGITHYTWETSHDERVRSSHKARNGERFSWDEPPPDGHPGQPIRCRCVAIPDLTDLLD